MKNFKNYIVFLLINIIVFSFTACSNENKAIEDVSTKQDVIKVIDCAGREVEIPRKVERIADLTIIDGTRTLIELGAHDKLVGISKLGHMMLNSQKMFKCPYLITPKAAPELKDLPIVGDDKEPNIEMLMSLNPDVIFIDTRVQGAADSIEKQTNIPVVCVGNFGKFDYKMLTMLGTLVDKEERANELVELMKSKVKLVTDITEKIPEDEKKSIFYWSHPYVTDSSPKTNAYYEVFELAGGINVALQGDKVPKGVYEITKEQLIAWDPEILFLHSPMKKGCSDILLSADDVKKDEIIKDIKAIKNDEIYFFRGECGGWDLAVQIIEVFYVSKILYPEKFQELNVEKEGDEILKKFYGIDGLYTDMVEKTQLYQWK